MELKEKLIQMLDTFEKRQILKNIDNEKAASLDELSLARYIKELFEKNYPHLEIRRLLKTVHYANSYKDKTLQEIAFIVDEVSEYLFKEELANRDYVVGYFNTLVIGSKFEPTERNFIILEIESIIENYND